MYYRWTMIGSSQVKGQQARRAVLVSGLGVYFCEMPLEFRLSLGKDFSFPL